MFFDGVAGWLCNGDDSTPIVLTSAGQVLRELALSVEDTLQRSRERFTYLGIAHEQSEAHGHCSSPRSLAECPSVNPCGDEVHGMPLTRDRHCPTLAQHDSLCAI
ncbi:hypothetical protein PsYK624_118550 [Phanerochaete sordida]|uniref:Uncharacterized protein n=1 Tax=Phanerochaete sordida TaxID=48140 RepID=A0A9P3GJZ3_9APHY|nr:hypothetical protein PsYK624_118550 [Phanerochaete sordida]